MGACMIESRETSKWLRYIHTTNYPWCELFQTLTVSCLVDSIFSMNRIGKLAALQEETISTREKKDERKRQVKHPNLLLKGDFYTCRHTRMT